MPARVPLDVDLEDKLVYGLTPLRLGYLVLALAAAFSAWSSPWAPGVVRGCCAVAVSALGVAAAWGRWRGRPADAWVVDVTWFALANLRADWKLTAPPWREGRKHAG